MTEEEGGREGKKEGGTERYRDTECEREEKVDIEAW